MDTGLPQGWAQIQDPAAKMAIQKLIASLAGGYHHQHNTDDTHSTILATGKITERDRAFPQGEWQSVDFNAANFTAASGIWTVLASNYQTFMYALIGRSMLVSFSIRNSIQAVSTTTELRITLPAMATVRQITYGTFTYNDNGTKGTGVLYVDPNNRNTVIHLYKDITASGTFSMSGMLSVAGQITVEVAETV